MLEQRLKSYQSKMQELSRIKPKDMAAVAQAGMISNIREHELKLNLKVPQPVEEKPQLPTRINRFERDQSNDLAAYQKKIEEFRQNERDKQMRHDYEEFRKDLFKSAGSRKPPQTKQSAEKKFHQRLLDQFEPISKERNRDLLQRIDEGIRKVDAKTDEKPFEELFNEYIQKYRSFMDGILVYHENRRQQGHVLEDIQKMAEIASQSEPL